MEEAARCRRNLDVVTVGRAGDCDPVEEAARCRTNRDYAARDYAARDPSKA